MRSYSTTALQCSALSAVQCCLIFLLAGFVTSRTSAQQPLFQQLPAKTTGIKFSNNLNETEKLNVLAYEYFYNGAGVAVGDINNDGLQDLFFTGNMAPNKLYLNKGNLVFADITRDAAKGLEGKPEGWKTGVTMADVNGDGLLDIYICYSGKKSDALRRNQLFINQGNAKFAEKANEYGLDDPGYSTNAVFFDYDNDGDLDMFLLNHNVIKIDNMEFARYRNETDSLAGNKLYRNDKGHFTEVSRQAGIIQNPLTFGLGVAIADINQDGWQDIYVTNDYNERDYLYINKHDGTFAEDATNCFTHLSHFSMGVDIADFNNDALPDVMTLDMLPEDNQRQKLLQLQENYESFELMLSQDLYKQYMRNMLQLNNGDGTFSEIGQLAGVSNTDWSWCPLIADLDNDGYKDIFVTNGYLRDYTNKDFLRYWGDYKVKKAIDREPVLLMDLVSAMPSTALQNYVFRNNKDLTFSNMQQAWGFDAGGISSGAVYADLDNDGDLELVINKINEPAAVYKNMTREQQKPAAYLSFKLKGQGMNTAAIGAKVYVYSKGIQQYQEVNPNRGYLSAVSTQLLFGLGDNPTADSVKIIWPDNTVQRLTDVKADQLLTVAYAPNAGTNERQTVAGTWFRNADSLFTYKHTEMAENDFKRQLLMMFMYSRTGPVFEKADVNKDGLEDMYIAGDSEQPAGIYLQQAGGRFIKGTRIVSGIDMSSQVAAAAFFDANGDGAPDLYVAKGGYSLFEPGTPALQDELYLNNGKGNFMLAKGALPDVSASSKSCVRPCDFDNDGDIDLFIGGRVVPGKYPTAPVSYLLVNNGKGQFTAATVPFINSGMITDARWTDIDQDGRKDLVLCGEFMPLTIYLNKAAGFTDATAQYFERPESGCWFGMTVADIDGDGHADIIAGNMGANTQVRASEKQPAELYYADFDKNGSIDPFLNFYIDGVSYPFVSRDELNEQIYPMRRKFSSYRNYSNATMKEIFSAEELNQAGKLTATDTRTRCLLYRNGKFVPAALPVEAQFSVVSKILVADYDKDGKQDLLLLGNHSDNRLKLGSFDAGYGCLLKGDGKGGFTYIPQTVSGMCVKGDVKSASLMELNGQPYVMIGVNNKGLTLYKVN
ncbi:VCBS repeat-containing protein [Chitinophaga rhizophila]|uniref:VCBS repeat-containing protein n=1 Tax=Chitinophaga rhizophila TaxID=2866212 RepID=A0ABS7GF01_9BACT|nr:VCBS repeat-containing protein [Chitinophaga rhizophila]MBW8685247.1 VCBS repeat-containing protein [Chitinophaga rhizophila]